MYEDLTLEDAIKKLNERDELIEKIKKDAEEASRTSTTDHEAEVSSLKKELEEVNAKLSTQAEELKKTKELNFTLGRQVANVNASASIEESLHEMFGRKE